jgi:hypothetical protein
MDGAPEEVPAPLELLEPLEEELLLVDGAPEEVPAPLELLEPLEAEGVEGTDVALEATLRSELSADALFPESLQAASDASKPMTAQRCQNHV